MTLLASHVWRLTVLFRANWILFETGDPSIFILSTKGWLQIVDCFYWIPTENGPQNFTILKARLWCHVIET